MNEKLRQAPLLTATSSRINSALVRDHPARSLPEEEHSPVHATPRATQKKPVRYFHSDAISKLLLSNNSPREATTIHWLLLHIAPIQHKFD